MAKRELSSTLKNMKFMQRAAKKEENLKGEEEEKGFSRITGTHNRKCIVVMEGNPQPGALVGRMSFQNFNPLVDKLNEEAGSLSQAQKSNGGSSEAMPTTLSRENGSGDSEQETSGMTRFKTETDDMRTKKPKLETSPSNQISSRSTKSGCDPSPHANVGTSKKKKTKRVQWEVLRPPTTRNNNNG